MVYSYSLHRKHGVLFEPNKLLLSFQLQDCTDLQSYLSLVPCYVDAVWLSVGHIWMVHINGVRFCQSPQAVADLKSAWKYFVQNVNCRAS